MTTPTNDCYKVWYGVFAYTGNIRMRAYEGPNWELALKTRKDLEALCVERVVLETWSRTITSDRRLVMCEQDWDYKEYKPPE